MDSTESDSNNQSRGFAALSRSTIDRGQMLGILRALQIASVKIDGDNISGAMSKAVLRTIDDHGKECWAGADTIAKETCLTERTVRRAIKALEALGIISVDQRTGRTPVCRIRWGNLHSTPEAPSDVESISTPEALSDTPEALSLTPEALSLTPEAPSDEALRSVKKRPKKRNTQNRISTNVDESLLSYVQFWNSLKTKGLVSVGASEQPSEGVVKGWQRVQKSKPLQAMLSDKRALESKIREQPFLLGAWFGLAKLLGGKNGDGEYIVRKILDGGYVSGKEQRAPPSSTQMTKGAVSVVAPHILEKIELEKRRAAKKESAL